jgi:hypothetical protein
MRMAQTLFFFLLMCGLNAEEPKSVSPFAQTLQALPRTDTRSGAVTMSDGTVIQGLLMFTRGRKLEIFEEARQTWHALDLVDVSRMDNEVVKEEKEREWRFKESGNDEKVFTGRVFIDHTYRMNITRADGKTKVSGRIRGMALYVQPTGQKPRRILLHSDHRGPFGGEVKDLVYVKSLTFDAPTPDAPGVTSPERPAEQSAEKKDAPPTPP